MAERFEMRMEESMLQQVDEWRAKATGVPNRAEAVRRLVELGLIREQSFRPAESLLVTMMAQVCTALRLKSMNYGLIADALLDGQLWALDILVPGLSDPAASSSDHVFVSSVMQMWWDVENRIDRLNKQDRAALAKKEPVFGAKPLFRGFDGNNETNYFGIAKFLVDKLGRFKEFAGRDLNSHAPMAETYRRMKRVYDEHIDNHRDLGAVDSLAAILGAQAHRRGLSG